MHMKIGSDPITAAELHAWSRRERAKAVGAALVWFSRRIDNMILARRSKRSLREMPDNQLHDLGLTRSEVERAGWF